MHFSFVVRFLGAVDGGRMRSAAPRELEGLAIFPGGEEALLVYSQPRDVTDAVGFLADHGLPKVGMVEGLSEAHLRLWGWVGLRGGGGEPPRRASWLRLPTQLVACPRMWRFSPQRRRELLELDVRRVRSARKPEDVIVACVESFGAASRLPFERVVALALEDAQKLLGGRRLTWHDVPSCLQHLEASECATCRARLALDAEDIFCSEACEARRCRRCRTHLELRAQPEPMDRREVSEELGRVRASLAAAQVRGSFDRRAFLSWCQASSPQRCCGFSAWFNPCVGCAECVARYRDGVGAIELQNSPSDRLEERADDLEWALALPRVKLERWTCPRCLESSA